MKIQGPHPLINTYKQLQQQQQVAKKSTQQKDQLNISTEAKKMQEIQHREVKRSEHVNELKQLVQNDEYKVDHEKVAQKMVDFWSKGL